MHFEDPHFAGFIFFVQFLFRCSRHILEFKSLAIIQNEQRKIAQYQELVTR